MCDELICFQLQCFGKSVDTPGPSHPGLSKHPFLKPHTNYHGNSKVETKTFKNVLRDTCVDTGITENDPREDEELLKFRLGS